MIIELNKPCNNLMFCDFNDKTILSFELDKQQIKEKLQEMGFQKFYNFNDNINFIIQIDNTPEFNSINLREIEFKNQYFYTGNIVYSCITKIVERQLSGETTFYYRVKIKQENKTYNVKLNNSQTYFNLEFNSDWSDACKITIKKDYTMDILHSMYNFISDYNAYNKEVKSANFYNFLLPHAKEFNNVYSEFLRTKETFLLSKCDTSKLDETFGNNYGFNLPFDINAEEYRRLLMTLRQSYMNAGTFNSIKNNLKYFLGEDAIFKDYRTIFPWILRSKNHKVKDPENPSYKNFKSNYYLHSKNRSNVFKKNRILLLSSTFKKFNFEIKFDNFFNVKFDKRNVEIIINKLKPVYTKYILVIEEQEDFNPPIYTSPLLVNDTDVLLGSDNFYIQYR